MNTLDAAVAPEKNELILVVDDQPDMVQLISFRLRREGYRVETAADGADALDQAMLKKPRLIILDLILPEINGFSLCELFRRSPVTSRTPIIMVSGWDEAMARPVSLESGANEFLTKPFSLHDLVTRVKMLLDSHPQNA